MSRYLFQTPAIILMAAVDAVFARVHQLRGGLRDIRVPQYHDVGSRVTVRLAPPFIATKADVHVSRALSTYRICIYYHSNLSWGQRTAHAWLTRLPRGRRRLCILKEPAEEMHPIIVDVFARLYPEGLAIEYCPRPVFVDAWREVVRIVCVREQLD